MIYRFINSKTHFAICLHSLSEKPNRITSNHPFFIKTAQGTGSENQASGVNNGGASSGVVNWTPTAAGKYYYQCSFNSEMVGTITVQ